MKFFPPYMWLPPGVEYRATDEPDPAEMFATINYDHMIGRLGSDTQARVSDTGGDTEELARVSTEVAIPVTQFQEEFGGIKVLATFACQNANFVVLSEHNEPGGSDLSVHAKTRPYIAVPVDGRRGREYADFDLATADITGEELLGGFILSLFDSPVFALTKTGIPMPGRKASVAISTSRIDRSQPFFLGVGLETTIEGSMNDWSINVRYISQWLLEDVELVIG